VFFWGLVTLTHALIKNKAEYLAGKLTIPLWCSSSFSTSSHDHFSVRSCKSIKPE
jgi:hypothetical protein